MPCRVDSKRPSRRRSPTLLPQCRVDIFPAADHAQAVPACRYTGAAANRFAPRRAAASLQRWCRRPVAANQFVTSTPKAAQLLALSSEAEGRELQQDNRLHSVRALAILCCRRRLRCCVRAVQWNRRPSGRGLAQG